MLATTTPVSSPCTFWLIATGRFQSFDGCAPERFGVILLVQYTCSTEVLQHFNQRAPGKYQNQCCTEYGLCGDRVDGDDGVEIHPPKIAGVQGYQASLQSLVQQVPNVIVQGIPTVERAVVEKKTKDDGRSISRPCWLHT